MPERLQQVEGKFLVLFVEREQRVFLSSVSFASVGQKKDEVVLDVNYKGIASVNFRHVLINKKYQQKIVIELNDMSLEIIETFYCLGDTIGARGGAPDSVITTLRSRGSKFRDLVPLLARQVALWSKRQIIFSVCTQHYAIQKLDLAS